MKEIKNIIEEILAIGYVLSLATLDEGGVWASNVVYIYDSSFNIYWISQISTRHSKAIEKNNKVVATITISGVGDKNKGLQVEGIAEKVERPNLEMISAHVSKRFGQVPHKMYLENNILTDPEMSWYKLAPKKIELIYEEYYGFEKQVIELN